MLGHRSKNQTKGIILVIFIIIALFGLVSTSGAEKPKRIILIETMPVPVVLEQCQWFVTQLQELGYKDGINMDLILIKAEGDRTRAERLLKEELARGRPDLVVTSATLASQTALKILKGTDIPIIFMTVSDPVGAGIIEKIGPPTGTNITGRVHMIDRETRINMVMRLIGDSIEKKPIRIGFIHSSYPSSMGDIRELKAAAAKRQDIVFMPFTVDYLKVPEGLPEMLYETRKGVEALKDKVDFWWEPSGPLGEVEEFTRILMENPSIPIVMGTKLKSVELGALLHLTPNIEGTGREVGLLADAILKGADPGKIPVMPPTSFDLGINLTTALKMKIVIPPDILKLAGSNIFR